MTELASIAVLGEVLWDLFDDHRRLGGAALNFAAHARALGHPVSLISGLGDDALGHEAGRQLAKLDLDTALLQTGSRLPTGTARITHGPDGTPAFAIVRPAAYDAIELSPAALESLSVRAPDWLYFGTLFASTAPGRRVLEQLLERLGDTRRFYDLNLRPGADSPELVAALIRLADVVKLNHEELLRVAEFTGLPDGVEAFCRAAAERYGLDAIGVSLGECGCAMLAGDTYVEAPAIPIVVADTVGAGDAFAATFLHGLCHGLSVNETAALANRVASRVAARHDNLPVQPPTRNVAT